MREPRDVITEPNSEASGHVAGLGAAGRTRRSERPPSKQLAALTLAIAVALVPSVLLAQASVPDPLDRAGPYDYSVIDADLRRVLTDLGGNLGIAVSVDPAITGRATGPLPTTSARAFLDRLTAANNLAYFYDGQVLHVTPASANESRLVALDEVSFGTLRDALASLGVLDERFALRPSGDGTVALAAGPPRYVALVEATLAALIAARPDEPAEPVASRPLVLPAAPTQPPERTRPPSDAAPSEPARRPPLVVFRGGATQVLPDGRPSE